MVNVANRDRDRDKGGRDSGRGKGGFVYRERSTEDVKRRAEQKGGTFDSPVKQGIDTWRPKPGENEVRILPPSWDDHDHYGFDTYVHSFVGGEQSTFLCLKKMFDKACPCCEAATDARKEGESEDAKQLTVKKQVAVWIIDRDDKAQMPQLWLMGWTLDREIAEQSRDAKHGKVLLIDHPDEGYDIVFRREGQMKNTKYVGVRVARESSPICERQKDQQKILDFIQDNPIPDCLKEHDADYITKALTGTTEKPDEDLDDKRGGRRSRDDKDEDRGTRRERSRDDKDEDKGEDRGTRRERSRDDKDDKGKDEDRGSRRERSRDDDKGGDDNGREERRERGRGDREESDRGDDRSSRRSRDDDGDRDSDRSEGRSDRRSSRDDKDRDEGDDRSEGRRSRDDDSDNKRERSNRSRDDDGDKGGRGRESEDKDPPSSRRGREETDEEDRGSRRGRDDKGEKDQDEDRPRRSRREK